jgi:translation initiation factor 3 subunit E
LQVPQYLSQRRIEVKQREKILESKAKPIVDFMSNPNNVNALKQDKPHNLAFLQKEFGIGELRKAICRRWFGSRDTVCHPQK